MEALGYMAIYLFQGELPWQGIALEGENEIEVIGEKKEEAIRSEDLFSDLPSQFKAYFDEVELLGFADEPNYSHLRRIFLRVVHLLRL